MDRPVDRLVDDLLFVGEVTVERAVPNSEVGVDVERLTHLRNVVELDAVEAVNADNKRNVAAFEEIESGETVVQSPGVGQHDRADRTAGQLVPHEPESVLARGAEQVQDQFRID